MLGLYLAIIAAWFWWVLVFGERRHARGALLIPILLPLALLLDTLEAFAKWASRSLGGFVDALNELIDGITKNKKGGAA